MNPYGNSVSIQFQFFLWHNEDPVTGYLANIVKISPFEQNVKFFTTAKCRNRRTDAKINVKVDKNSKNTHKCTSKYKQSGHHL